MFISLTQSNGVNIRVNSDHIVSVEKTFDSCEGSKITTTNSVIVVQEKVDYIIKVIYSFVN